MTIRHLRIFTEVCSCGSVTGAAKKLYLAQPSVSLAIRELEEHYGVKLFDRIARRLDLTEAGARLLTYATHIISLFDDMRPALPSEPACFPSLPGALQKYILKLNCRR